MSSLNFIFEVKILKVKNKRKLSSFGAINCLNIPKIVSSQMSESYSSTTLSRKPIQNLVTNSSLEPK